MVRAYCDISELTMCSCDTHTTLLGNQYIMIDTMPIHNTYSLYNANTFVICLTSDGRICFYSTQEGE